MKSDKTDPDHFEKSSYIAAQEALTSLITRRRRGDGSTRREKYDMMLRYVKVLDLEDQIANLKVIHVAGTKGKGSTCTFCEAILREIGYRTGLFTSPHLIDVTERYRLNGSDISQDKFLLYFWDCWNQLKVDVAILEVGLGGIYDATNVVKKPLVCGITSLGMDHIDILGDTLGKIAAEKAGIFKIQVPAFTVPQLPEAMDILKGKASELAIPLNLALPLDPMKLKNLKLGLNGDHQLTNAGLAVCLCQSFLQSTGGALEAFSDSGFPEVFSIGLATANLSGRAQIINDMPFERKGEENHCGQLVFYLDGAHSPESMEVCARWFSKTVKEDTGFPKNCSPEFINFTPKDFEKNTKNLKRVLLFNCMEMRDPEVLLPRLVNTCHAYGILFSKALFVPSMSSYHKIDSGLPSQYYNIPNDLLWQSTLQKTWDKIVHGKDEILEVESKCDSPEKNLPPSYDFIHSEEPHKCDLSSSKILPSSDVIPSLPCAIKWLRDCVRCHPSIKLQVLVTGSLHLVGDVMKLLRR